MDRPTSATSPQAQPSDSLNQPQRAAPRKRKGHRGGRKKRPRRKSFAFLDDGDRSELGESAGEGLYQMPAASLSGNSIDSEVLLDHRLVYRPRDLYGFWTDLTATEIISRCELDDHLSWEDYLINLHPRLQLPERAAFVQSKP